MTILSLLSGLLVLSFIGFLVWLAGLIVFAPQRAEAFLRLYASSARAHYIEQIGRVLAGLGLLGFAAHMHYAHIVRLFGWTLVITSLGLMITPWQWHHKMGETVIPMTIRFKWLYALGALILGTLLLYSASRVIFP